MEQKNLDQPQGGDSRAEHDAPEENVRKVMVIVVPLQPSPFVMLEESYDFALPLFGGIIPHCGS
jgi:hypothetical protein